MCTEKGTNLTDHTKYTNQSNRVSQTREGDPIGDSTSFYLFRDWEVEGRVCQNDNLLCRSVY